MAQQKRKDDTRRKIIAGALILEHAEKNKTSDIAKKLNALIEEYVVKPNERSLFGLAPLPGSEVQQRATKRQLAEEFSASEKAVK